MRIQLQRSIHEGVSNLNLELHIYWQSLKTPKACLWQVSTSCARPFTSCVGVTVVTPSQLRYSWNSSNVPGPHIILRVKLLTPFTSGLPFLLCSSFVLTLLIRKHHLVFLLFCSIVLHSQIYLQSELRTPCYVPFLVIVLVVPHNRLIIFPFHRYIHSHRYIYGQVMYDRISSYIDHSAPICANL